MQAEAKNLVSEERTLVSGMIESWDSSAAFPLAQIRSSLGQAGSLATESKVQSSALPCAFGTVILWVHLSFSAIVWM